MNTTFSIFLAGIFAYIIISYIKQAENEQKKVVSIFLKEYYFFYKNTKYENIYLSLARTDFF
jgi:hypothetical protein